VSALAPTSSPDNKIISVLIFYRDENNQNVPLLKGATIRVYSHQDPSNKSLESDDDDYGGYYVDYCIDTLYIVVAASGFTTESADCHTGVNSYTVVLHPVPSGEDANYSWMPAGTGSTGCTSCHNDKYLQWQQDGHATVFSDQYFGTMYTGTDVYKRLGIETQTQRNSTGQKLRERNDSPYGPGYVLDHPNEQGNCAYCHVPAAVQQTNQPNNLFRLIYNYNAPSGDVKTEGITCDVCHKVTGVVLGDDGLPFSDRPGVLSLSTTFPAFGQQIVLGPNSNVTPDANPLSPQMACEPIYSESKFCAACHYGKFADSVIYNSYGEWLQSKYSPKKVNPDGSGKVENSEYRSCQDCHMLSTEKVKGTSISSRTACSAEGDMFTDFDHNMMKYSNGGKYNSFPNVPQLIEDAATLTVKNEYDANTNSLLIQTNVENVKAGHKFPTDSPLRHLILVIEARDEHGNLLPQISGDVIPAWGGVGNTPDDYAGMPGKIYANLLTDRDTNLSPTAAYWNPTKHVFTNIAKGNSSDTRLDPNVPDNAAFGIAIPSSGKVSVTVKLVYRYAFIDLARQKGWTRRDIIVTRTDCTLDPTDLATDECK